MIDKGGFNQEAWVTVSEQINLSDLVCGLKESVWPFWIIKQVQIMILSGEAVVWIKSVFHIVIENNQSCAQRLRMRNRWGMKWTVKGRGKCTGHTLAHIRSLHKHTMNTLMQIMNIFKITTLLSCICRNVLLVTVCFDKLPFSLPLIMMWCRTSGSWPSTNHSVCCCPCCVYSFPNSKRCNTDAQPLTSLCSQYGSNKKKRNLFALKTLKTIASN